jgi:hypothetical protein
VRRLLSLSIVVAIGGALPAIDSHASSARPPAAATAGFTTAAAAQAPLPQPSAGRRPPANLELSDEARRTFIARAQVWHPVDVASLDLRLGPQGAGAFTPHQLVTCDFVEKAMHGATRKFYCVLPDGDAVKVRYGEHNGEVQGSVIATRLLWALGFAADRVYPVHIRCRGCSADPWHNRNRAGSVHDFEPAVIERKPAGYEMRDGDRKAGWIWPELDLVDAAHSGAPTAHRDALRLLAVFMQHSDTKRQQQRLLCASDQLSATGECDLPFLMLHDVGVTFGRANGFNRNSTGSVNLAEWQRTPIWKDAQACVGDLNKSHTGTLGDPRIGEAGRQFLSDLLLQLSDRQLRDLFEVAGVERRASSSESVSAATVEQWVAAFKSKRQEIAAARCPY